MKTLLGLAASLSLGCALPQQPGTPISIPIMVKSYNRSSVDVYLLCGNRDARWLGVIPGKEAGLFEVPASEARCASGLNFFLVHRDRNRGYWVGPFWPRRSSSVHLRIEKYAGLSEAYVADASR